MTIAEATSPKWKVSGSIEEGWTVLTSSPRLKAGDSGTTYRWFGAFAPSRVAPWPSCFDTDRPVREDSR